MLTISIIFGIYLRTINVYLAKTFAQTDTHITIKLYKKDKEGNFKHRQGVTLSTGKLESVAENYTKNQKIDEGKKLQSDSKI